MTLLGGGANKEKDKEREKKEREREKAREARRARQIYFGGIAGLQPHATLDTEMDDAPAAGSSTKNTAKSNGENGDGTGDDHSLTFFAVMCAVLAIGASIPSSSAPLTTTTDAIKENPAFLYALSQQALGVWDTPHVYHVFWQRADGRRGDGEARLSAGMHRGLELPAIFELARAGDGGWRCGARGNGRLGPHISFGGSFLSAPAPIINAGITHSYLPAFLCLPFLL